MQTRKPENTELALSAYQSGSCIRELEQRSLEVAVPWKEDTLTAARGVSEIQLFCKESWISAFQGTWFWEQTQHKMCIQHLSEQACLSQN